MQAARTYKLIKRIKDERFDEDLIHQYTLLIQIGARDFQVAAVADDHRVLFFEDYVLHDLSSSAELLDLVKTLFEAHDLLSAGFWKYVRVAIKNNKFVQVPAALFVEQNAPDYLKFNASVDGSRESIHWYGHPSQPIVTVFALDTALASWLQSQYARTEFSVIHQSTAFIEGVLAYAKTRADQPLYLYVDRFRLHIAAVHEGQLLYYNQFAIRQFADYVKYIMLVMNTLSMDPASSRVILWGYIGRNSPHYQEFYKYIRNVEFGHRPPHLLFGYLFDEVQEHHFFDLFSVPLPEMVTPSA